MKTTKDSALCTTEQCVEIIRHATNEDLAELLLGTLDTYGGRLDPVDRAIIAEAVVRLAS